MGMFHCSGLSMKISVGRWSLPNDSPMLKHISQDFRLGVKKAMAMSIMSVAP